jgi:hypothetical protein
VGTACGTDAPRIRGSRRVDHRGRPGRVESAARCVGEVTELAAGAVRVPAATSPPRNSTRWTRLFSAAHTTNSIAGKSVDGSRYSAMTVSSTYTSPSVQKYRP